MSNFEDALMDAVLETLSEKVSAKALRDVDSTGMRKKLLHKVSNEMFYTLLSEGKVNLGAGFGSLVLKSVKGKKKKVFNRKTKKMDLRHVGGSKVVYIPGTTLKEFL